MFRKRKRDPALKTPQPSGDRELAGLRAALGERQEKLAQLELDLLNSQNELAAFNTEIERRLGPLQRRLETVEAELAEARHHASRRALWGERASSPDTPEDVVAQYQRLWGRDKTWGRPAAAQPAIARPPSVTTKTETELKALYRSLAKRFHPDLGRDPSEKPWRARMMARVNDAYRAQDLSALRQLASEPAPQPAPAAKSRDQNVAELRSEIKRLDELTASLGQRLDELANSPAVQLKLEAMWARRAGGDLLTHVAAQLEEEIARAEKELGLLR
jgi:hypothetical protein